MKLTGAQILCEGLVKEGVEVIFGFPGGAVIPLYDTLPQYPQLRHILVRHEQGAAHAADGYARATGKVGVCFATSGPGATNLVTGIANAFLDSVPVIAVTGQVHRDFIGRDALVKVKEQGPAWKLCYFVLDETAWVRGGEAIMRGGEVLGVTTSGNYGHTVGHPIVIGYVPAAEAGHEDYEIEVFGETYAARRSPGPVFDPKMERMKI